MLLCMVVLKDSRYIGLMQTKRTCSKCKDLRNIVLEQSSPEHKFIQLCKTCYKKVHVLMKQSEYSKFLKNYQRGYGTLR